MAETQHIKLGALLKEKNLITDKHINYALNVQKVTKEKLGQVLTRLGLVPEDELVKNVAKQLNLKYINLSRVEPDMQILRTFNRNFCLNNQIFPLYSENNHLIVATSQLPNQRLEQAIMRTSNQKIEFRMTEESKLVTYIYNYFYFLANPVDKLLKREIQTLSNDTSLTVNPENFLHYVMLMAIKMRATDIHINPMPQGIGILFRIDGVLRDIVFLPKNLSRIITSIKLQADMDISEQRLPQDGRWRVNLLDRPYDIRVSSVVTPDGENIVMRLLSQEQASFSLESLGFLPEDVQLVEQAFDEPHGIVLLTGPTGSGKSTTLVAGLNTLDLLDKNVLTVENPIEYIVPLARQTQVNESAGYDFSNAMRYFLRHDPDVILVGEMRDEPTAKTALTAATTGHMVLSTLHSNTALGAIPRLLGMGMDSLTLSETLVCVLSQRLVRTICPYCIKSRKPNQKELDYLNQEIDRIYFGQGCDSCLHTGYLGRTMIYEVLLINAELRKLLERGAPLYEIENKVYEQGFRNLFDVGVQKLKKGLTTVEELQRVIGRFHY
jgi:general secretion pathway protein E/type IV pilus assembly protein PilB